MSSTTNNLTNKSYSCISQETLNSRRKYCSSTSIIRDDHSTGFHNLPTIILLKIFSYLDENDLRKSIIPVCHKWRLVACLPQLWHNIKFNGPNIPEHFICKQLRSFTNLESVHLNNILDVTTIIRQLCRCTPNLIKIAVTYCQSKEQSDHRIPENVLRNLVMSCRYLKEINLKGTQFYANAFYVEVAALPEIKSINLSDNKYLNTKNLFKLILNTQNLEELKLSNRNMKHKLTDDEAIFLFSHLNSTLKSITFDMMGLTDPSLQILLQSKQLEKLYLLNAINISGDALVQIGMLPNLKYLKICHSQLDAYYLKKLFTQSAMSNLKLLNLSGSWKLTSDGLKYISECCKNLEKAVFKCCKNLDNIDSLLHNCKNIISLNLAFCDKLTGDIIQRVPVFLNNLKYFYLDNTRISIVEHLKINNCGLKIYICQSEYNKLVNLL